MITLWNKFFKPLLAEAIYLWEWEKITLFFYAIEGLLGLSFLVHFGALLVGKPYSNRFYEWEASLIGMHPLAAFFTLPLIISGLLILIVAFHFFYGLGKSRSIL